MVLLLTAACGNHAQFFLTEIEFTCNRYISIKWQIFIRKYLAHLQHFSEDNVAKLRKPHHSFLFHKKFV